MSEWGSDGILCVGLACVDCVSVAPRFPTEDSQLLLREIGWAAGGNAANNARVLRQLRSDLSLFAALAGDEATLPIFRADMEAVGVDLSLCPTRQGGSFSLSNVILNEENGSRTILHHRSALAEPRFEEFAALPLHRFRWIHFEARNMGECRKMMDRVRELSPRPKISVEVEKLYPGLEALIPGADVVLVSKDFARLHGWATMEEAVKGVAERWADAEASVVCAWGEEGAAAFDGVTRALHSSPAFPPPRVVDTLGAGDTFVAGTLDGLLRGLRLDQAIRRGCQIAGAKVGHVGLLNIPLPPDFLP